MHAEALVLLLLEYSVAVTWSADREGKHSLVVGPVFGWQQGPQRSGAFDTFRPRYKGHMFFYVTWVFCFLLVLLLFSLLPFSPLHPKYNF